MFLFIRQSVFFFNFSLWIFSTTHGMKIQAMEKQNLNNPCNIKTVEEQIADWTNNLHSHIDFDLMGVNTIFELMFSETNINPYRKKGLLLAMEKDKKAILNLIIKKEIINENALFSQENTKKENMTNVLKFFEELEKKEEEKGIKRETVTGIKKIISEYMDWLDKYSTDWRNLSNSKEIIEKSDGIFVQTNKNKINDQKLKEKVREYYDGGDKQSEKFFFVDVLEEEWKKSNNQKSIEQENLEAFIDCFSKYIENIFMKKYDEMKRRIKENFKNLQEKDLIKMLKIILPQMNTPYILDHKSSREELLSAMEKDKENMIQNKTLENINDFFKKLYNKHSYEEKTEKIKYIIQRYLQNFNKLNDPNINQTLRNKSNDILIKDIKIDEKKLTEKITDYFNSDTNFKTLKNFPVIKVLDDKLNIALEGASQSTKSEALDIKKSISTFSQELKFIFIESLIKSQQNDMIKKIICYINKTTKEEERKELENDIYNQNPSKIIIKDKKKLYENIIKTGLCINEQMNNGVFFNPAASKTNQTKLSTKALEFCDMDNKDFSYQRCLLNISTNITNTKGVTEIDFSGQGPTDNTLAVYFDPLSEKRAIIHHSHFVDAFCSDAEFKISIIDPLELDLGWLQKSINIKNIPHWNMFSGTNNMFNHDNGHHKESNALITGRLKTKLRMVCSIRKNLMKKKENKDKNQAEVLTNAIFFLFHEVPSNIVTYYKDSNYGFDISPHIDKMIKEGQLDQFIEHTKNRIKEQFSTNRKDTKYKMNYRDHETYLKDIQDSKGDLFYPKKEKRSFDEQKERAIKILNKNENKPLETIKKEINEKNEDALFLKLDQAFKIKFKMAKLLKLHPIACLSVLRKPLEFFNGFSKFDEEELSSFVKSLSLEIEEEKHVQKKDILKKAHEYSQNIQSWIREEKWQEAVKLDAKNEHNDVIELYLKNQIEQIEREKSETKEKKTLEKYEETKSLLEAVLFEYKEKLTPQEVAEKLNNFLDYFVEIVREHDPEHKIINKEKEKNKIVIESHNN